MFLPTFGLEGLSLSESIIITQTSGDTFRSDIVTLKKNDQAIANVVISIFLDEERAESEKVGCCKFLNKPISVHIVSALAYQKNASKIVDLFSKKLEFDKEVLPFHEKRIRQFATLFSRIPLYKEPVESKEQKAPQEESKKPQADLQKPLVQNLNQKSKVPAYVKRAKDRVIKYYERFGEIPPTMQKALETKENLEAVTSLDLTRTGNFGAILEDFVTLFPNVQDLNLTGTSLFNNNLVQISKWNDLRSLNLTNCKFPHELKFPMLRSLHELILAKTSICNADITILCEKVAQIAVLDLSFCRNISADGFLPLTKLQNLTKLSLKCTHIEGLFFSEICMQSQATLRVLDISFCQGITITHLKSVLHLRQAQELILVGTKVNGVLLKRICKTFAATLQGLDLSFCKALKEDEFEAVTSLKNLKTLVLYGTRINQKSADYLKIHLQTMPILQKGQDLTDVEELIDEIPDDTIEDVLSRHDMIAQFEGHDLTSPAIRSRTLDLDLSNAELSKDELLLIGFTFPYLESLNLSRKKPARIDCSVFKVAFSSLTSLNLNGAIITDDDTLALSTINQRTKLTFQVPKFADILCPRKLNNVDSFEYEQYQDKLQKAHKTLTKTVATIGS